MNVLKKKNHILNMDQNSLQKFTAVGISMQNNSGYVNFFFKKVL